MYVVQMTSYFPHYTVNMLACQFYNFMLACKLLKMVAYYTSNAVLLFLVSLKLIFNDKFSVLNFVGLQFGLNSNYFLTTT